MTDSNITTNGSIEMLIESLVLFTKALFTLDKESLKKVTPLISKKIESLDAMNKAVLLHTIVYLLKGVSVSKDKKSVAAFLASEIFLGIETHFIEICKEECPSYDKCDHKGDIREKLIRAITHPEFDNETTGDNPFDSIFNSLNTSKMDN